MADLRAGVDAVDLSSRLDQALRIALADHVFVEDEAKRSVVYDLICSAVCVEPGSTGRAELEAMMSPVRMSAADTPEVNPIWQHPGFVAPAIAALAILFDEMLDPAGQSGMRAEFTPDQAALFRFRLGRLTAKPEANLMRLSTCLVAAADFCLSQEGGLRVGGNFLYAYVHDQGLRAVTETDLEPDESL